MSPLPITDPTNLALGLALALGFVLYLFAGSIVVPGTVQLGSVLADGSRKPYKLNGLALLLITVAIVAAGTFVGWIDLAILHRHFWGLFVAANLISIAITAGLYFGGRTRKDAVREGLFRDLWLGVELNPSWAGIDVKMFSYRPSLIGLALLNASFAYVQWERDGGLSDAMILYQAFTAVYVFNYFQFEHGMLYTWDVVAERFGFMLVWGDYAFVPFAYSICGWFILDHTEPLPLWAWIALPSMFLLGLWIFRGSNQQKDEFKRDPSRAIWGKKPETIGGKILVSGFWGIGRKLNYTGEILVYWSFTLLSGFDSFVPYLLPTWLFCLLAQRAWRDDKRCREKYGPLWEEYCRRATFKMIPFVY